MAYSNRHYAPLYCAIPTPYHVIPTAPTVIPA